MFVLDGHLGVYEAKVYPVFAFLSFYVAQMVEALWGVFPRFAVFYDGLY